MMNQLIIVGRLVTKPEIKELEDEKKVCYITVAVPRSYKNENGEYDTDFIKCTLWNGIADNASDYLNKGDVIAVKGRIQTTNGEMEIVAEKVSFLSSKKEE
jgi:single-strand DNA-binding protein